MLPIAAAAPVAANPNPHAIDCSGATPAQIDEAAKGAVLMMERGMLPAAVITANERLIDRGMRLLYPRWW